MIEYTFFGKVHPERANVSIAPLVANIDLPAHKLQGTLNYAISLSQVTASFRTTEAVTDISTLKNIAEEVVRIALDALGYTMGCGYDLEITLMVNPQRARPVVFGVDVPEVRTSAGDAGISIHDVIQVFSDSKGRFLQAALADLREAIRVPRDTGFFCYRAVESLRQFFVQERGAEDDSKSWQQLREDLGVNRDDLDAIKAFADPIRHGGIAPISGDQRADVCRRTWDVVNRFVLYANSGYKKLDGGGDVATEQIAPADPPSAGD